MRLSVRQILTLSVVASTLGAFSAAPASADGWGWGGHGWSHHGGYRGPGRWDNGAAAAALGGFALGGFALGAIAGAAARQPLYDAPYEECIFVDRPVTDGWGNVVDVRRARICE
jgi:hypothetical protein